jgi:hypothetical protein
VRISRLPHAVAVNILGGATPPKALKISTCPNNLICISPVRYPKKSKDGRDPRPSSSPEVEVEFFGPIYRAESEVSFQPPRVKPRWRSLSRVFEVPES